MKLTNQQVTAVATEIFNKVKVKNLEKKVQETKKVELEILKAFQKELKALGNNVRSITVIYKIYRIEIQRTSSTDEWFVREYDVRQFLTSNNISVDIIKNDVLLATIDSTDLKALLKTVEAKYQ